MRDDERQLIETLLRTLKAARARGIIDDAQGELVLLAAAEAIAPDELGSFSRKDLHQVMAAILRELRHGAHPSPDPTSPAPSPDRPPSHPAAAALRVSAPVVDAVARPAAKGLLH